MKRKPLLLIPLLLLAGGLYYWFFMKGNQTPTAQLTLYGNVEIRETQLAFNGSEHIAEILVEEGQRVSQGQTLARLHTELLAAELAQAQAQLQAQQANLDKLIAGSRPEEIKRARAQAAGAQARAQSSADSYKRLKSLLARKLASDEDVEDARAIADAAAADLEAAQQTLILLQQGPRQEDIAIARAEVAATRAALILAEQRLADATLTAPQVGIVRDRLLEPGEFVTPQNPVLTLALTQPIWVRAYLPETALGQVRPGMAAQIHTDSYPGKSYPGWVGYISPTAEFTPKNVETPELRTRLVYQLRVFTCNPDQELRLGMPATVTLDTSTRTSTGAVRPDCGN